MQTLTPTNTAAVESELSVSVPGRMLNIIVDANTRDNQAIIQAVGNAVRDSSMDWHAAGSNHEAEPAKCVQAMQDAGKNVMTATQLELCRNVAEVYGKHCAFNQQIRAQGLDRELAAIASRIISDVQEKVTGNGEFPGNERKTIGTLQREVVNVRKSLGRTSPNLVNTTMLAKLMRAAQKLDEILGGYSGASDRIRAVYQKAWDLGLKREAYGRDLTLNRARDK